MHEKDLPHAKALRLPVKNDAQKQLGRDARTLNPTHDAPRGFYAEPARVVPEVHVTKKAMPTFTTGMGSHRLMPGETTTAPVDVTARRLVTMLSPIHEGVGIHYGGKTYRHGMTPPSGDFLIPKGATFSVDANFPVIISWGA